MSERRRHFYKRRGDEYGDCWCGATVTATNLQHASKTHDDLCAKLEAVADERTECPTTRQPA